MPGGFVEKIFKEADERFKTQLAVKTQKLGVATSAIAKIVQRRKIKNST